MADIVRGKRETKKKREKIHECAYIVANVLFGAKKYTMFQRKNVTKGSVGRDRNARRKNRRHFSIQTIFADFVL